jgi:hypothetical protein
MESRSKKFSSTRDFPKIIRQSPAIPFVSKEKAFYFSANRRGPISFIFACIAKKLAETTA